MNKERKDHMRDVNMQALLEEIDRVGVATRRKLLEENTRLAPDTLADSIPSYTAYEKTGEPYIWKRTGKEPERQVCGKVFLLVSGISASGKHAILKAFKEQSPYKVGELVTATTRGPKEEEKEGIDHYFVTVDAFTTSRDNGELLEWVQEGERFYGTPKESIKRALEGPATIITSDVEIGTGWPAVEAYVATLPADIRPTVIKVFVIPDLDARTYFEDWIVKNRDNQDMEARSIRSGWELVKAPERGAHYLITNPIAKGENVLKEEAASLLEVIKKYVERLGN